MNRKGRWPEKTARGMQHISALVQTPQRSILALWRTHPAVFESRTVTVQHYAPSQLWVDVLARDTDELGRLLRRLVGEHQILDLECQPVTPP